MLFPLVHACYKDMQHRSKHNSIIWAWRNRAKLKFLSDIHWLNTIQYFIAKLAVFWHISTKLNGLSCLAGLLSGPCSFLLPDVQTWICTVHTQDLKPTVLPQYIDEMRSRSSMAKKTHSHIPPLSKKDATAGDLLTIWDDRRFLKKQWTHHYTTEPTVDEQLNIQT